MKKHNDQNLGVQSALTDLSKLADANTIIGTPIISDKTTIIPISRVTLGVITGKGEYGDIKVLKYGESFPSSGGIGAVMNLSPIGFLTICGGRVEYVACGNAGYERLLKITEDIIDKIESSK